MTIADLCLLGTVLLILVSVMPGKIDGRRDYANANPRDPAFYTPGLRVRALGAHQNGYKALPFFAAAVLLAEMRAVPQGTLNALAIAFLLARIGYVGCYLGNRPSWRSALWALAFACNLAIFLLPAFARS